VETVPAGGTRFVLVASDGEFKASELGSGEPAPAHAEADGSFTFSGKRGGVYVLEVQDTVLARRADDPAAAATGPTVCKALVTDADRLNVVLLRDPVLREIRLPVIAHLMTALHTGTRAVRTCPASLDPTVVREQRTARDEAAVRTLFGAANAIWGQARVRWELRDVVPESFATAGRDACHVTEDERNGIFAEAATPGVLNLFLFGSMEVQGEAGVHVVGKLVDGADVTIRTFEAVAMGDRILLKLFANADPIGKTPDGPESEVILAHELGHYLSLDHVQGSGAATQRRLMLPHESPDNRRLVADEVRQARASDNARDCGRISVEVAGATRFGGSTGHRFVALRDAAAPPVTVDARVAPTQLNAPGSTFVMTGGDPGASPTQRTVSRAGLGRREVVARWTAAGGGQQSETYAAIHLVDFDVAVEGARALGNGRFLAIRDPNGAATVRANVFPEPVSIPRDLVSWSGGGELPDPLRRRVPLTEAGETQVSATVAGVTKPITLVVAELKLEVQGAEQTAPGEFMAAREDAGQVQVHAVLDPPVPDAQVQWTGGEEGPTPRIRIVRKQAIGITPVLAQVGGAQQQATVNVVGVTLSVSGATPVAGPGNHHVAVAAPGQNVIVTATLTPQPNPLPQVQWQGGERVIGQPLQQRVPAGTARQPVTVTATILGTPHSVVIHVVTFTLRVENAVEVGPTGSGEFAAAVDAAASATVTAVVTPALSPLPADLVTWDAATLASTAAGADATQRTFPLSPARLVTVAGTVGGVTKRVRVQVMAFELEVEGAMRFGGPAGDRFVVVAGPGKRVSVHAVVTPLPSPAPANLVRWQGGQRVSDLEHRVPAGAAGAPVRVRATLGTTTRSVTIHVVTFRLDVANAVHLLPLTDAHHGAAQDPGQRVTVSAVIAPAITNPPDDLVVWQGDPTTAAGPLARTLDKDTVRSVRVVSAVGGTTREVLVDVMAFRVEVAPSTRLAGPLGGPATAVAAIAGAAPLTATAVLNPLNGQLPNNAIAWNAGTAVPGDQARRRFARATVGSFDVQATFAGTATAVRVTVIDAGLVAAAAPAGPVLPRVQIEGVLDTSMGAFADASVFGAQRDSMFQVRVEVRGIAAATATLNATLRSQPPGTGPTIESVALTLTRVPGTDRFLSLPILAIPRVITRAALTFAAPRSIEVVLAEAGGRLLLDVADALPVALFEVANLPVRGRVVHIFAQAFTGSGATAPFIRGLIATANRVWAQAGVEIRERSVATGVAPPAGGLILATLERRPSRTGQLTNPERRLLNLLPNGPARSAVANDMNVYFIGMFTDPNPTPINLANVASLGGVAYSTEGFFGVTEPGHSGIAMEGNVPPGPLLAHELGHHLLRNWAFDEHADLQTPQVPWGATNVMRSFVFPTSTGVDRTQVENILTGTAANLHPVIRFVP
jgi:hypothetical protein